MTITDVRALTVGELLRRPLRIPPYQRPYSWTATTAVQLVTDVRRAMDANNPAGAPSAPEHRSHDVSDDTRCPGGTAPYVLGTVILHANGQHHDLVDGQQRTLTLRMLHLLLDEEPGGDAVRRSLENSDGSPIGTAWRALRDQIAETNDRSRLRHFLAHHCQIVQVVTSDLDEAFRIFDSQNYRGKSLLPHDLLKAHHLREMRKESEATRAAVVERWEWIDAVELDRLFSVYLHRIHRWSHGLDALSFEPADIEVFKGITASSNPSPWELYHRSAQTAMPLLGIGPTLLDQRTLDHARFQLNAPVQAGRDFFDMTTFMHEELKLIHQDAFTDEKPDKQQFDGFMHTNPLARLRRVRPVFRYATESYLAAVLYATNIFGLEKARGIEGTLFRWAYEPRVEKQRLQEVTVDNRGKEHGSPFRVLRNARSLHDAQGITREELSVFTEKVADYRTALRAYLTGSHS